MKPRAGMRYYNGFEISAVMPVKTSPKGREYTVMGSDSYGKSEIMYLDNGERKIIDTKLI